jgi:hypothetical protein
VSDYRDERVGLRRRLEELEARLRELLVEGARIEPAVNLGIEAHSLKRAMFRMGRFVRRLIRSRGTSASNETAILRAEIVELEQRIMQVETIVRPHRWHWPRKTSPFYENAVSHGHSENPDTPGQGDRGKS